MFAVPSPNTNLSPFTVPIVAPAFCTYILSPNVVAAVNTGKVLIVPVPPIPPPPPLAVSIILPFASTSKLNVGVPVIVPDP